MNLIDYVNKTLKEAIDQNASDIHFEPYNDAFRVRFRIDGLLHEFDSPPLSQKNGIASRIKVMSNLDIAEKRLPQDGRFKLKNTDFRISTCPTINGEKIALRILESQSNLLDIDALGMDENQLDLFIKSISKPQGLILVTGPTGSGKTITLYNALNYLNNEKMNISTVEDPIEMQLHGINQLQVDPKIGLTFSNALRAFLRQDPDILMVGEIRDKETAEIAIRAAHTGHLVLSTLHTNNATETVSRLKSLGVDPHDIENSIQLILSQRLIRKICTDCKASKNGCNVCKNGYKGRTGIFELLPKDNEDCTPLWESGLKKVERGITTLEELHRIINF